MATDACRIIVSNRQEGSRDYKAEHIHAHTCKHSYCTDNTEDDDTGMPHTATNAAGLNVT
jgi:hypothetical protein